MEHVLKWQFFGTGGDDVHEKSQVQVYSGDYSLHLKTRTTGAAYGDYLSARRYTHVLPVKKLGVGVVFYAVEWATMSEMEFSLVWTDGSTLHTIRVRYVGSKWQYFGSASSYHDIPGGSQGIDRLWWHRLHFRVDLNRHKYTQFNCNALDIDVSNLSYPTAASASKEALYFEFNITTSGALPCEAYFDQLILLQE